MAESRNVPPTPSRLWLYVVCGAIFAFLVIPCLIVLPMSFNNGRSFDITPEVFSLRWYQKFFTSREWLDSLWMSIKVAIPTVLLATPIGTAAAYSLQRSTHPVAGYLRMMFMLPMILPHILIAVSSFTVFSQVGLNNTLPGLVLAHVLLALPIVIITVSGGLAGFDTNQEAAAVNLGASRLRAFLTVTAPQIKPSIIAGAFLAFFTSFDELMIVLFVSSGGNSTLSRRMFVQMRDDLDPTIAAISAMFVTVTVLVVLVSLVVGGRKNRQKGLTNG